MRQLLIAAILLVPLAGASPASADPVDLVCPFAATLNFSPGISLIPKAQQITGTAVAGTSLLAATPCSSLVSGIEYIGGTATGTGSGLLGCIAVGVGGVVGSGSATAHATWNNGDVSTIDVSVTLGSAVPVLSGTVTSGALQGSTITPVIVATGITGNCLLSPVTSVSVAGVLIFTRL